MKIHLAITVLSALLSIGLCYYVDTRGIESTEAPLNNAIVASQTRNTTIRCCVTTATISTSRLQWWEYGTRPGGNQISDGNLTLPYHPNYSRYQLQILNNHKCYNLIINSIGVNDGTKYMCVDFYADTGIYQRGAQLAILNDVPVCTDQIDPGVEAIEGVYYTKECKLTFGAMSPIAPVITWTGPQAFTVQDVTTTNSVTSTIAFYAARSMNSQTFTAKINFTSAGFGGADMATNIPSYTNNWVSQPLIVRWPPNSMYITPIREAYDTDTTLTCGCDANPNPIYSWQAVEGPVAGRTWQTQNIFISRDMTGFNRLRCNARNIINGLNMTADAIFNVTVNPFNPCSSNPCQFGGECETNGDVYTCRCPVGVTGTNCESVINYCTSLPCQNGGTCVPAINSYSCICNAAYTGTHCQTPV